MALDTDKIDEAVLALLWLTRHDHGRAWKGFDWEALNRLHRKGMIAGAGGNGTGVVAGSGARATAAKAGAGWGGPHS